MDCVIDFFITISWGIISTIQPSFDIVLLLVQYSTNLIYSWEIHLIVCWLIKAVADAMRAIMLMPLPKLGSFRVCFKLSHWPE